MKVLIHCINSGSEFAPYISAIESTGAEIDGTKVMFECDNWAAKMLADTLVEYEILAPAMEADEEKSSPNADGENSAPATDAATNAENKAAEPNADNKTASAESQEVLDLINKKIEAIGLDDNMKHAVIKKISDSIVAKANQAKCKASDIYSKLVNNVNTLSQLVFNSIQRINPDLYEELKTSGVLNDKGKNAVSIAQENLIDKIISQLDGQIEVPAAFNVEIDDTEWDNALITSFGFPMINLTSPLVREMLRAPDPKSQKRAYKQFTKELKSDPDVAQALGLGFLGTLGLRGGSVEAKKENKDNKLKINTESVKADGKVLVEGPITALNNPVDILKSIAKNKGTPCRRNNLVVMYDEVAGKSGDSSETVNVIPLGVSGGTLIDLNLQAPVPMNHLTAFYSVVDPKASIKSYAKAMAEINTKSDNVGNAVAAAGKQIISKIPVVGSRVKKKLEAEKSDAISKALVDLAEYSKKNGHPPFYLLKPKSDPKEINRWSDENAAHGYQMVTTMIDGHKAGMILKEKTAEALFRVG